jgi:tetratricopeptide (TPR) repeat protein
MRVPGFWKKALANETAGSEAWRDEQRQLMASLASAENRGDLAAAYKDLAAHGGVSLGDLVLASAGTAALTDADFAAALASFANNTAALPQCGMLGPPCMNGNTLVGDARPTAVRYLAASRAFAKGGKVPSLVGSHHDGAIGALWDLRVIAAKLTEGDQKGAVDDLIAMGNRAPLRRLLAASTMSQNYYSEDPTQLVRAWDALAVGEYKNVARAQAAQALMQRGRYDEAADRIVTLASELDLDADPPSLQQVPYMFQASRRGNAGWQLAWAQLREKVMSGGSFEHVVALLQVASDHPNDQLALLGKAADLAGDDVDRKVAVARLAWTYGQTAYAQQLLEPVVKRAPSHALYEMLGQIAWQQGRGSEALAAFEAAQDAPGDDKVDINVMRNEYLTILQVARTVALQSTGSARADIAARAMVWGTRWREADPSNAQIDAQLGELELALGDKAEAWRQLSTAIERDPMSGDGYQQVAQVFENQGRVAEALDYWEQAIRIDQTNPTPRIRKARALIALGKTKEGDALLHEIAGRKWHEKWDGVMYEVQDLLNRSR